MVDDGAVVLHATCSRLADKRKYIIENYSSSSGMHWCCFYELNINSDCDLKCFHSCNKLVNYLLHATEEESVNK